MRIFLLILSFLIGSFTLSSFTPLHAEEALLTSLNEEFENLENWSPLYFKNIEAHSSYRILSGEEATKVGAKGVLEAISKQSASGLLFHKSFNCYKAKKLSWRWRVESFEGEKDPRTKSGDDYPIRLYVTFAYDPEKVSFFERVVFEGLRVFYGKYPPLATINYLFAGKPLDERSFKSPYTDRAMIVVKDAGRESLGIWRTHTVNIFEDYKKFFGELPPKEASLAIMSDSDNTGGSSKAMLDFIHVFSEEKRVP